MNTYTLTATLNSKTNRKTLWARNDSDAMMEAITHILNTAHKNTEGAWAKGAIKLVDSEGNLVAQMEEK